MWWRQSRTLHLGYCKSVIRYLCNWWIDDFFINLHPTSPIWTCLIRHFTTWAFQNCRSRWLLLCTANPCKSIFLGQFLSTQVALSRTIQSLVCITLFFLQIPRKFPSLFPLKFSSSLLLFTRHWHSAQWGAPLVSLRRAAGWACTAPPQDRLGRTKSHCLGFSVFSVMNSREGLSIGKILELEKALFNKEYRREGMKRTHTHTHKTRRGKQKPRRIWFARPQ